MGPKKDADNLETLDNEDGQEEEVETEENLPNEDEEQGEGTGTEEEPDGQEDDTSPEGDQDDQEEEEDAETKGMPNDPKLLKKALTQKSQELADYKREVDIRFAELEKPAAPEETDRKKLLAAGKIPPEELTKEDMASMTPQQYTRYLTNVAKGEVQEEFNRTYAPTMRQSQINSAKAVLKDFFADNPEAKEMQDELKEVMVNYAGRKIPLELTDAWDIVKGRHPEVAEKKVRDKTKLKKRANMIKDSGTPPSKKVIVKDKASPAEAVEAAFDQLGIK